jgi:hypothetical protein
MLDALRQVPPVQVATAEAIALVADSYRGNLEPSSSASGPATSDPISRSRRPKASRVAFSPAVVRFMRSSQCLELGTAYGMSALFILEALKARGTDARLTTLEGYRLLFSLSSRC